MIRLLFLLFSFTAFSYSDVIPECYSDGTIPFWSNHSVTTVQLHPNYNNGSQAGNSWSGKYYLGGEENIHYWRTGTTRTYIGPSYTPGYEGQSNYINGSLYEEHYGRVDCFATDPCPDSSQTYDSVNDICIDDPAYCPPNSTYDLQTESCSCTPPYIQTYDLNGFTCTLPECESVVNGLSLFAVVSNVSQCNFFQYSDNLYLGDDTFGCCYGTQNDVPTGCPPNTMAVGDRGCLPIDNNPDHNDTTLPNTSCPLGQFYSYASGQCQDIIQTTNLNDECPQGQYYNFISNSCLDVPDNLNNDSNGTELPDGDTPYGDTNGSGVGGVGDADGDGVDDIYNDALSGVESSVMGVLNSYVLIHAPFNASGSCSSELSKTVSLMGVSYTIDLAPYVAMMNEYIPVIRSIVLFMFALSGILLVLAGRGE